MIPKANWAQDARVALGSWRLEHETNPSVTRLNVQDWK